MKFNIVAGSHPALVNLEPDGKGGFSGTVESGEFGKGVIRGVITGDNYHGSALMDGHTANFDATIANGAISGTIKAGWFLTLHFTGTAA